MLNITILASAENQSKIDSLERPLLIKVLEFVPPRNLLLGAYSSSSNNDLFWAGEMAPSLRALSALLEVLGSVNSKHM